MVWVVEKVVSFLLSPPRPLLFTFYFPACFGHGYYFGVENVVIVERLED